MLSWQHQLDWFFSISFFANVKVRNQNIWLVYQSSIRMDINNNKIARGFRFDPQMWHFNCFNNDELFTIKVSRGFVSWGLLEALLRIYSAMMWFSFYSLCSPTHLAPRRSFLLLINEVLLNVNEQVEKDVRHLTPFQIL